MTILNHDYPTAKAMQVVNPSGTPIEGATVRVFEALRFYANNVNTWFAETTTDTNGYWRDPIDVPEGRDWVVQVQKMGEGPAHVNVTT